MERKLPTTEIQMLDQTQYENFLNRAGLVLGLDKTPATRQQWNVLAERLYRLL